MTENTCQCVICLDSFKESKIRKFCSMDHCVLCIECFGKIIKYEPDLKISLECPCCRNSLLLNNEGLFKQKEKLICYENGNIKSIIIRENNGRLCRTVGWHRNGVRSHNFLTVDGKIHGKVEEWYDNGTKKRECHYLCGAYHGKLTVWHKNGIKSVEGHYNHGKKHGFFERWHPNGTKIDFCFYRDNKLDGIFKRWNVNGKLSQEYNYSNNELHGVCRTYDQDGILLKKYTYTNGLGILKFTRSIEI